MIKRYISDAANLSDEKIQENHGEDGISSEQVNGLVL